MNIEFIKKIPVEIDLNLLYLPLDYQKLSDEILSKQQIRLSNSPVSSGFEDTKFFPTAGPESELFLNTITKFFKEGNFKIHSIWTHIHQPLESTNLHHHGGGGNEFYPSFVYYVKVPKNSGKFVVSLEGTFNQAINPSVGNLLLFSSWVPHFVTKNLSNDIRISISGNLVPIK